MHQSIEISMKKQIENACKHSGHGSFSDSAMLNNVVGHLLHSFILVPYHGWYQLLLYTLSLSLYISPTYFYCTPTKLML